MENEHHNDKFSIAVDRALLKLSKDFGVSIPKDDYVLIQLYLNREIIHSMMKEETLILRAENEKTKQFFREALASLTKKHNEQIKSLGKITKLSVFTSCLAVMVSIIVIVDSIIGG